jgi:soluble lytic murein transglycosylase
MLLIPPSFRSALLGLLLPLCLWSSPAPASTFEGVSDGEARQAQQIFAAIDNDRWTAAERLTAHVHDRVLAKLVTWLDLQRPQSGHGFDEIAAFVDANPDWPRQRVLTLRAEDVMDGVADAELAAWFSRHEPISPLARLRAADLLFAAGKAAEARARVEEAWIDGNFSDEDAAKVLAKYGSMLSTADHIRRTDRLLWSGESEQAVHMLPLLTSGWRLLVEARLKLAAGAPGAARALDAVPQSLRNNGGLLFDRMRWRLSRGDRDGAIAIMESAADNLGQPERWWPYRQVLARYLLEQGDPEHAYRLAAGHALATGTNAAEAEFLTGWIALRFTRHPELALPHFIRLHDLSQRPVSSSRGAYWAARAAHDMGDETTARQWFSVAAQYPTTFYGQLAAAEPGIEAPPHPEPEAVTSASDMAAFRSQELVRAIFVLNAAGEDDLVKTFFVTLANRAATLESDVLLADLAERIGRPDLGVAIAKIASYSNIWMMRAGYPLTRVPRNAGAEQALLLAITRQESAFDTDAVSPTGARGLMQLEPGTAAQIARKLGLSFTIKRLTANGYYNVTLGQAYLDDLIARFDGSYVLAIAAYNAGPARVSQWLAQFGDPRSSTVDTVDWIEKIPFGETRDYVQRVLENLQVYRLRIGKRDLAFSLPQDLQR